MASTSRHDDQRDTFPSLPSSHRSWVKRFAPKLVILVGSLARGEARWDFELDLDLVIANELDSIPEVVLSEYG